MTYSADKFSDHLFNDLGLNSTATFYVAFSGGVDSTVLLHMMKQLQVFQASRTDQAFSLIALHVNHNIQSQSADWVEHCREICQQWNIVFKTTSLQLTDSSELSARNARYQWFSDEIDSNSILLTGHHSQDRAETVLFNLMRGAGSRGLSSLRAVRPFHGAKLVRPLLELSQQQIIDYATDQKISWVEDPSNREDDYSRNQLRHHVLPALTSYRPDAIQNIVRAAANLEQENDLLREVAICDLVEVREFPKHPLDQSHCLCYEDFMHLSVGRQANLVRFWLQSLQLHTPSKRLLNQLVTTFSDNPNSTMVLQEQGHQFRFYQGYMYVMPVVEQSTPALSIDWINIDQPIDLYERKIQVDATLKLRELIQDRRPSSVRLISRPEVTNPKALQGHSLNLKKWLQEIGVPPWRRQALPLLTIEQSNKSVVLGPVDQQMDSEWVSFKLAS